MAQLVRETAAVMQEFTRELSFLHVAGGERHLRWLTDVQPRMQSQEGFAHLECRSCWQDLMTTARSSTRSILQVPQAVTSDCMSSEQECLHPLRQGRTLHGRRLPLERTW